MRRKRLTQRQKAHNRAEYNRIRRAYNTTDKHITYKEFKTRVINRAKGTGESIKEAALKEANTRSFVTAEQQGVRNVLSGMKSKFRNTYDELRRRAGKFNKGEKLEDRIEYDKKRDAYILKNPSGAKYEIKSDTSPQNMYLIKI